MNTTTPGRPAHRSAGNAGKKGPSMTITTGAAHRLFEGEADGHYTLPEDSPTLPPPPTGCGRCRCRRTP